MRTDDPYEEDEHPYEGRYVGEDGRYVEDDEYVDRDDESTGPYSFTPFGWPVDLFRGGPEDPDAGAVREEEDGSWWDEGLITLLIVGGAIMFLFPEPITSTIGVALISAGLVIWIFDAIAT